DDYWKRRSIRERAREINVPALSFGGWFDNYVESDLDLFSRLAAAHKPVETWIGPWAHNPGLKFPTVNFGPEAHIPIRSTQAAWFDRWLHRDSSSEETKLPLLHLFVMGPNIWREEHEWPLARARFTAFYLTSEGHANTHSGDGALLRHPIVQGPPDIYTY